MSESEAPLVPRQKQTYKSKFKISLIVLNITLSSFYFGYTVAYFGQIKVNVMIDLFGIDIS